MLLNFRATESDGGALKRKKWMMRLEKTPDILKAMRVEIELRE